MSTKVAIFYEKIYGIISLIHKKIHTFANGLAKAGPAGVAPLRKNAPEPPRQAPSQAYKHNKKIPNPKLLFFMEKRKLKIRDLTLRDGQQSLFATRLSQKEIDKLLPYYENAGFYIMEVWGGAVPDSVMRYLDESPWDRLRIISKAMKGKSLLSALSRGRNLFGYVPYPDYVLEGFYKEAIKNGLNVMRIFDALNDIDNVKESIRLIN